MRRIVAGLALAGLLSGLGTALHAQGHDRGLVEVAPRPVRAGGYLLAGVGIGRDQYSFTDDPNSSDGLWKPTVTFGIGGTPSPNVRVGFEYSGWFNSTSSLTDGDGHDLGSGTEVFHQFLLTAQAYPDRSSGLYIKGGAGLASSGTYYRDYDSNFETGFGWVVGAGYEVPLSRNVALAPLVEYRSGMFTERGGPTLNEHVLNIGASLTFQSGRRWR
jgi:opacity protein-like surface antigen